MKTLAALAFIAAIAGVAAYLAQRETVADGRVLAGMLSKGKDQRIECDDRVPIGREGAVFACNLLAPDGSRSTYEVRMNRKGEFSSRLVSSAGSASPRAPAEDPWPKP